MRIVLLVVVVVALGCGHAKKAREKPPVPPMAEEAAPAKKDAHFDEVKKAAAEQLQCPLEQINIVCLRRDADGECISVRADGCEKSFEYQFGDV